MAGLEWRQQGPEAPVLEWLRGARGHWGPTSTRGIKIVLLSGGNGAEASG